MLKRRSFLQGIAATVLAGLGISKTKAGLEHLEGQPVEEWQHTEFLECLKRNHPLELNIPEPKEGEFPIGTRLGYRDGRVFRYVAHNETRGNILYCYGYCGVTVPNGWIQTYGPCLCKAKQNEESELVLVHAELE